MLWTYRAVIDRWIDGDTVDVNVDLGFYTWRKERLRLLGSLVGIDAFELRSRVPGERELAVIGLERARQLAPEGTLVIITTHRRSNGDPRDGFGRFLAQITANGTNVGDTLLAEGLAEPYQRG